MIRPQIRLTNVVLPAPFGPMIARISPAGRSKSTFSTARRPPNSRDRLRVESSVMATMAAISPHRPEDPSWKEQDQQDEKMPTTSRYAEVYSLVKSIR